MVDHDRQNKLLALFTSLWTGFPVAFHARAYSKPDTTLPGIIFNPVVALLSNASQTKSYEPRTYNW